MPRITTLALPAILAAAAVGAVPASAAPQQQNGWHNSRDARVHYASFGQASDLRRDIARLDYNIDRALARHKISWREARGLKRDVDQLQRQMMRAQRGGLTRYEARAIEARITRLDRELRFEMADNNRRPNKRDRMARAW
ncbi:MAG: hypothetical protein R3D89_01260 [Sphingomonadaceae bacterium]|jgi:hypothetical protein